jgi:hypothetical protein
VPVSFDFVDRSFLRGKQHETNLGHYLVSFGSLFFSWHLLSLANELNKKIKALNPF